jgi:hypothetical protein
LKAIIISVTESILAMLAGAGRLVDFGKNKERKKKTSGVS